MDIQAAGEGTIQIKKKKGKCRNPESYINELFKHGVAGSYLKDFILHILIKTTSTLEIPEFMKKTLMT